MRDMSQKPVEADVKRKFDIGGGGAGYLTDTQSTHAQSMI